MSSTLVGRSGSMIPPLGGISMRTKHLTLLACVAITGLLTMRGGAAQTPDVRADYDRSNGLNTRIANKMIDVADAPNWIENASKFSYRKSVRGGFQFVLVDPVAKTRTAAFDHARLAAALVSAPGGPFTATTLPFSTFTFADNMQAIEFTVTVTGTGGGAGRGGGGGGAGGRGGAPAAGAPQAPRYRCALTDYTCARQQTPPAAGGQGGQGQGRGGRGANAGLANDPLAGPPPSPFRPSPDGKSEAFIQNYNVYIRPVGGPASQAVALSTDGSEGNAYRIEPGGGGGGGGNCCVYWSPDVKKIAAMRRRPGYNRLVTYVRSSPDDQLQPNTFTRSYRKPGDVMDFDQPVLFDVATKKQTIVDGALFPNPFNNTRLEWRRDSTGFTFEYNERGHQTLRVIEVDAATGASRAVIEETSKTFIYYNRQAQGLSSGRTYRWDSPDGKEIIWMSQRD